MILIWLALPPNLTCILIVLLTLSLVQISYIPCTKSHVHIPSLSSFIQKPRPDPRLFRTFRNKLILRWMVVNTTPNSKLDDYPSLFVRRWCSMYSLLPSATRACAMLRWQGTHLTWCGRYQYNEIATSVYLSQCSRAHVDPRIAYGFQTMVYFWSF
jgi:hypothetical protein